MNNTLIVYFTYTNNTKTIAEQIQKKLNCDIIQIETKTPYSKDYQTVVNDNNNSETSNYIPEIKDINIDLKKYDTIILGTPVWWYRPVPAIRAFLTKYDLRNKTIIPFATNAGWLGKTFQEIKELAKNSVITNEKNIVFESYSNNLKTNKQEIDNWIETLK